MRKANHYIKTEARDFIFDMTYYENKDQCDLSIKMIYRFDGKLKVDHIEMPDVAVRTILSLYQQLKFEVK